MMEEYYACVRNFHSRLISKIDDYTELLETDDQGDPVYPNRGIPESRYNHDSDNFNKKDFSDRRITYYY